MQIDETSMYCVLGVLMLTFGGASFFFVLMWFSKNIIPASLGDGQRIILYVCIYTNGILFGLVVSCVLSIFVFSTRMIALSVRNLTNTSKVVLCSLTGASLVGKDSTLDFILERYNEIMRVSMRCIDPFNHQLVGPLFTIALGVALWFVYMLFQTAFYNLELFIVPVVIFFSCAVVLVDAAFLSSTSLDLITKLVEFRSRFPSRIFAFAVLEPLLHSSSSSSSSSLPPSSPQPPPPLSSSPPADSSSRAGRVGTARPSVSSSKAQSRESRDTKVATSASARAVLIRLRDDLDTVIEALGRQPVSLNILGIAIDANAAKAIAYAIASAVVTISQVSRP
jgi:hypothetical protein